MEIEDVMCPRCGEEPETWEHRMWKCPRNGALEACQLSWRCFGGKCAVPARWVGSIRHAILATLLGHLLLYCSSLYCAYLQICSSAVAQDVEGVEEGTAPFLRAMLHILIYCSCQGQECLTHSESAGFTDYARWLAILLSNGVVWRCPMAS